MLFIAVQEEDYRTGGFNSVLNTPYPLTRVPLLVLPVLAQYLCSGSVLSLSWGSGHRGHFHLHLPSHLCKVLSEISRALCSEQCLVAGLPSNYLFSFWGWAMNRVTVWGCILLHMWVVVIISWELLREHPPTNCSMGVQNIVDWNLRLALLICAFLTPNCLLTALPTGPNCILWAKTKNCLASFYWNLAWTACCWCCSKFSNFCFILVFYSTWVWDLGSLDDTSIGNCVQLYIKGLNHLCSI